MVKRSNGDICPDLMRLDRERCLLRRADDFAEREVADDFAEREVMEYPPVSSGSVCLTKQQKRPRRIKFLQERPDHSWDVHAIRSDVGVICVKRG